ncbi:hypothetical protein LCGC14_1658980 [marine sediment metagenome]|uniref:4Fe-4S ferredoxin-type domain-containing protein n=1 Tax=marine sediment metagenome TaxID=412755 RepID=A0A0F9IH67_9ZZZZ
MADSKIAKDQLGEFLGAVSADYAVYGPRADGEVIAFGPIASADELVLDYRNSTISPKEMFLPKAETVYEFDGQELLDDKLPEEKRVIFAMRPCDCRAVTLLDRVFDSDKVKDPFYVARRANTVIIALACSRPMSTCFCTATGGDPFGEEGADILLADAGKSLNVKAVTERGKDFLGAYSKFFSSGAADWAGQGAEVRKKVKANLDIADAKSRLDGLFEDDIWESVSRHCLGCGTCSFLCPVCYCFDLTDEKTPTGARKVRRWDCCMFSEFTLHASGHNPRAINAARLRQKIMHKFSYFTERYGVNGCVGCGRCTRSCPVNLDIRRLLGEVMAAPEAAVQK